MNAALNLLLNAHQSDLNWRKLIHYNIQYNDQLVLFITFNIYLLARKLYSREFLNISCIPESLLKSWKSPNINCNILWGTGFWNFRPNFYLQIGTSNETLPPPLLTTINSPPGRRIWIKRTQNIQKTTWTSYVHSIYVFHKVLHSGDFKSFKKRTR